MRHTLVVLTALGWSTSVAAAPVVVTVEGGAEADTNVQRVETGPGLDTSRIGAGVLRVGAKLDKRARALGGVYGAAVSALTRLVSNDTASTENVTFFTGEARYLRPVEARSLSFGATIGYADALPLTDPIGARTFRNVGVDGLLVLDHSDDTHLSIGFGGRSFAYKENHDFDWVGPAASARLDRTLWAPSGGTRSLELAAILMFESRSYNSAALSNTCPPGAPPDDVCSAGTSLRRLDRSQKIGVELTYTGGFVATAGYQITVIDSTSYGQSLVRHKATISATRTLFEGVYATLLAQLQLDQYLDGLVIKTDTMRSEFTSLDDENRSSIQVRIGRPISDDWSVESRAAIWRNLGSDIDAAFRRSSIYVGVIYSK